jgi:hypothetical protein
MKKTVLALLAVCFTAVLCCGDEPYWVEPMKEVHKNFSGTKGFVATYGDSITYDVHFWLPLRARVKHNKEVDLKKLLAYIDAGSWTTKGPENCNYNRWTVKDAMKVIDGVLEKQKPEVAFVMYGTNDFRDVFSINHYDTEYRDLLKKIMAKGCIPVISTLPVNNLNPGMLAVYNPEIRKIAEELKIPLVEFYEEMIKRQPENAIPVLCDGIHPTWDGALGSDFSEEALNTSGYDLRNYLTIKAYDQIYEKILK